MVEIGQFKTIAANVSFDGILLENTVLKKQQATLIITLVITAGVAIALGYLYSQAMKKEIRISTLENNNLNTK